MKAVALVLLLFALLPPAHAGSVEQEAHLPAELQLTLLAKVMSYDRALTARSEVVIGVVHQRAFPMSLRQLDEWLDAAASSPHLRVGQARVRVVPIEFTSADGLATRAAGQVDMLFFTPMRGVDITRVAASARAAGARTAGGSQDHMNAAAVSLLLRGGRPHIAINLRHARAERSDYSAQLLRHTQVIE